MGKSEAWTARHMAAVRELIKIFKSAETAEQVRKQYEDLAEKYQSELDLLGISVEESLKLLPAVWWMWAVHYDPLPALKNYRGPVLAMFGSKDLQVSASANAPVMKKVLSNEDSKVIIFPRLNHLFQPSKTGSIEEYARIETTFDPGAMEAPWQIGGAAGRYNEETLCAKSSLRLVNVFCGNVKEGMKHDCEPNSHRCDGHRL